MKIGLTKEQAAYKKACKAHEAYISRYKLFLDRIVNHLEFVEPSRLWTTSEIRQTILNEIRMSESMDRPNAPGYEFANND